MRKVVSWNEYFIEIAKTVSIRSKDPNTQVGAVIVDNNNHIISTGFNGMPPGYSESKSSWEKPKKYEKVIHAEANAIAHSSQDLRNSKLYVTLFPCKECCKLIVTSGIKEVYYNTDKYYDKESHNFLLECGIGLIKIDD